jgi:hypothetical protein
LLYPLSHRHPLPRKKKPSLPRLLQHLPRMLKKTLLKATLKRTTKKPSPLRSKPAPTILLTVDDREYEIDADESLQIGYRRPEIVTDPLVDDLSDYVKFRLWLARQLALKKYEETWG